MLDDISSNEREKAFITYCRSYVDLRHKAFFWIKSEKNFI